MRRFLRAAAPAPLRIGVALVRRVSRDWVNGRGLRFAGPAKLAAGDFPHLVAATCQDIRRTAFAAGKQANLALGAARLDGVVLAPGETLSFWRLVGRPSAQAGFALGRAIRDGAVAGDIGGGLCQLSGILYEAGLRAGLDPVERHPHSRDIYAEAERFTSLGLDATVVWPYKDLRLANRLGVPLRLRIHVGTAEITVTIHAATPLPAWRLDVCRVDQAGWREVAVRRSCGEGVSEAVSADRYAAPLIPGSAPS